MTSIVMDEKTIKEIVKESLGEYFTECNMACSCPIPKEYANEISHLVGMVADIGDGDMRQAVENIRENHTFVARLMVQKGKVITVITSSFIVSVITALVAFMIYAIKESLIHLAE